MALYLPIGLVFLKAADIHPISMFVCTSVVYNNNLIKCYFGKGFSIIPLFISLGT